jgi:hypothetical protein
MNYLSPDAMSAEEAREAPRCSRCDAQPRLVRQMLDSRSGKTIRMFKCACGAQSWVSDPA